MQLQSVQSVIVTLLSIYTVLTVVQMFAMNRTRELLLTWWRTEMKSANHAVRKAGSVVLVNGGRKVRSPKAVAVLYTNGIGNLQYVLLSQGRVAEFAWYSILVHSTVFFVQMTVLYFEVLPKNMVHTTLLGTMLLTVYALYMSMAIRTEDWKISEEDN